VSVLRETADRERVPVARLEFGTRFVCGPAQKIATDGFVVEGFLSSVTSSMLTCRVLTSSRSARATRFTGSTLTPSDAGREAGRVCADTQLLAPQWQARVRP